jgi:hypothetical protein
MSDSEKNDSQQASSSNVYVIPEQTRATDEDFFDATDAVCLFNRRIESALEKTESSHCLGNSREITV